MMLPLLFWIIFGSVFNGDLYLPSGNIIILLDFVLEVTI